MSAAKDQQLHEYLKEQQKRSFCENALKRAAYGDILGPNGFQKGKFYDADKETKAELDKAIFKYARYHVAITEGKKANERDLNEAKETFDKLGFKFNEESVMHRVSRFRLPEPIYIENVLKNGGRRKPEPTINEIINEVKEGMRKDMCRKEKGLDFDFTKITSAVDKAEANRKAITKQAKEQAERLAPEK